MWKFPRYVLALVIAASMSVSPVFAGKYDLGRKATQEEVAAWDIDIRPDGKGLPEGRGSVSQGEEIWSEKCASCHGDFGEGIGRWPAVAGGFDTLQSDRPEKTIGSYWPYLSTVWDYVNRTMPPAQTRSLESNEIYALVAYMMNLNDLVAEDFELSRENFAQQKLPNKSGFVKDDRLSSPVFNGDEPCMQSCKPKAKIIMRAGVLDVTPGEDEHD